MKKKFDFFEVVGYLAVALTLVAAFTFLIGAAYLIAG